MIRILSLFKVFMLAAALGLPGCGGGAAELTAIQQLKACLGSDLESFLSSLDAFGELLVVAVDPDTAAARGITWTPVGGTDNAWTFEVPIDLDGDDLTDGSLTGRADFSTDPEGGVALGDFVVISNLALAGNPDILLTSPSLTATLTASAVTLHGTVNVGDSGGGCESLFTVDAAAPLEIVVGGIWPPVLTLFDSATGNSVAGTLDASLSSGANTLDATLTLDAASNCVQVFDVIFNSASAGAFQLNCGSNGGGGGGAACPATITVDTWVGTWDVDYNCIPLAGGGPTLGNETLTITKVDADTLSVQGRDNTFGGTFTFTIELGFPNSGAFDSTDQGTQEKGVIYVICSDGKLQIRKQSDYGSPGFITPAGTCSAEGAKR